MTTENTAPVAPAAPTTPTTDPGVSAAMPGHSVDLTGASTPVPELDARASSASHIDRVMAAMREREAAANPGDPQTPGAETPNADLAAPAGEYVPTAADAVLIGAPAPTAQEPAVDPEDPGIAQFVKLDREMRAEREAFRAEQEAFRAQQAEAANLFKAHEIMKSGGSMLDAFKATGLDYEQLTAEFLKGPGTNLKPVTEELAAMRAKLEELPKTYEAKIEALKAEQAEAVEKANRAAWEQKTVAEISGGEGKWDLLTDPLALKTMTHKPLPTLVYETIERHWTETGGENGGELLTTAQAADKLQASLERMVRESAPQSAALARILALSHSAPNVPSPDPASNAVAAGTANGSPSLHVSTETASNVVAGSTPEEELTAEDYKRRALEVAARYMP